MERLHVADFKYDDEPQYFDTDGLIDEIEELDAHLNLPHSIKYTQNPIGILF